MSIFYRQCIDAVLEKDLVMQSKLSILRSLRMILTVTIYRTFFGARDCAAYFSPPNHSERVSITFNS